MRLLLRLAVASLFCVGCAALQGCGTAFTGSLTGRDGNGTGAQPATGQAQITSLSPSTIAAGSADFTLTVTGTNFLPSTIVMWNDLTPLVTTYVSSTTLRATVPASLIAYPTSTSVVPSPVSSFNFGTVFTVSAAQLASSKAFTLSSVLARANDMVASPADGHLYLATSTADPSRPHSIVELDPQSGQFRTVLPAGGSPGPLAISADGTYLYVALNEQFLLRRFRLPLQPDITIPLGVGSVSQYRAGDIKVQPTNAHTVAVTRLANDSSAAVQGDVAVYDDSVPRGQTASSGTNLPLINLLWSGDGQSLFSTGKGGNTIYNLPVTAAGVQFGAKVMTSASLSDTLRYDAGTGYLYSDIGGVINPATGAAVANFPVNALQGGLGTTALMIPDSKLNVAYFLGRTIDSGVSGTYVIEAFDLTRYVLLGYITLPNVAGTPLRFVRWGSNGLAFLTTDTTGAGVATGIYIVSGAFVTAPATP